MTGTGQISFKGGDNVAEKKPIIKVHFGKWKEAYFRLSEDEKKDAFDKVAKKREELGVRQIVVCDCRWSNEEWYGFGVEELPDMEAVHKFAKWLEEQELFRYIETKTYLGTRTELPS